MRKVFTILALLVLMAATCQAQQKIRKSVFGANAGVSIPLGEFALKTFTYDAGFAAPGPNLGAEYLYYGKIFGFSSSIGYASFFFNGKAYQSEYDRTLGGYGINDVSAGNYQMIKFLAGFTLKIPEIKHTEVMLLFHLGYAACIHPDLRVTNSEYGVINSIAKTNNGNLVADAGLKINYWLTERYGVSIKGSVSTTEPSFSDPAGPNGYFDMLINHASVNVGFIMNLKISSL